MAEIKNKIHAAFTLFHRPRRDMRRSFIVDSKAVSNCLELRNAIESYNANREEVTLLVIKGIMIDVIPENIRSFPQLTEIDLSGNRIRSLPVSIASLTQLRILNLSKNELERVPPILFKCKILVSLDLSCNKLVTLPSGLLHLTQLETLKVKGNKDLQTPPLQVCLKGKEAIFHSLKENLAQNRRNVWKRWKPYYEPQCGTSLLKSLSELCIDCILENEVDYTSAHHFPPLLKRNVAQEETQSYYSFHKCSVCKGYFTKKTYFMNHLCEK